jgi:hypothetical protein
MKKILLLSALTTLTAITTQAQLQLGLLADYHYSYLYNKSDVAADASLDYVNTFTPSFGLYVGYRVHPKITLVAEPQYYNAGQQFVGVPTYVYKLSYASEINLSYLKVPLYAQFKFASNAKGVSQYLQLGGYVGMLQHYAQNITDKYYINGYARPDYTGLAQYNSDNELIYTVTVPKSTGDSTYITRYQADKPKFNKMDYGLHVGYGIKIPIQKNLYISTDVYARYGFAAVDNMDTITYVRSDGNLTYQSNIKDIYYCRDIFFNPSSTLRDPKSNNIFAGILIRFVYTFPHKKSYQ